MKVNSLKSLLGILILGSMFNMSCNQNSPAPANTTAPSTPSATTSTTTTEGMALALVGHWYLDSSRMYTTPTVYNTTGYCFNWQFINSSDLAQHKEHDLTTTIQAASTTTVQSNLRKQYNILWFRNMSNDTTSYTSNDLSWAILDDNTGMLFVNAGNEMSGYVRSLSGNNLVLANGTTSLPSGMWYYWHRQ
jgi:hypothetical protein